MAEIDWGYRLVTMDGQFQAKLLLEDYSGGYCGLLDGVPPRGRLVAIFDGGYDDQRATHSLHTYDNNGVPLVDSSAPLLRNAYCRREFWLLHATKRDNTSFTTWVYPTLAAAEVDAGKYPPEDVKIISYSINAKIPQ